MSRPQSTYPHQQAGRPPADSYSDRSYPGYGSDDQDPPGRYPGNGRNAPGAPKSSKRKAIIATVAAAVVGGSLLGLGGAEWWSSRDSGPKTAPVLSLEQIADKVGCEPTSIRKSSDFSQGVCDLGSTRTTILTFESNQKMLDWIEAAEGYGGAYLVGTKWLVTSNKAETLDPLVKKLGGGQIMLDSHYQD
ncbi:hypothetical protein [Cryptosporangium japonicum]|uniref:Uncharacterized protein n=1 Tax=Cryptosporangium japonicum TaxID=80872 RepID=A0ABP3EU82_9ACTN